MQISTSLLVGCAAVLCILPQSMRAADTDAQAKAREALRQKLNELQPQPAGAPAAAPAAPATATAPPDKLRDALREKMNESQAQPPTAAPTPAVTPAPRVTEAPMPKRPRRPVPQPAPAPVPEPARASESVRTPEPAPAPEVVIPPPVESEAIAKQREAVRKKMEELQGHPSEEIAVRPPSRPANASRPKPLTPVEGTQPATPIAKETVKPAPRFEEVPLQPSTTPVQTPAPVPAPTFKQAEHATTAAPNSEADAQRAAQGQAYDAPPMEKKSKKRPNKMTPTSPTFPDLPGPELTISADKHQRLQELLRRYQADEVTPAQYHEERAKILAGP